jgi:hypothetical protein
LVKLRRATRFLVLLTRRERKSEKGARAEPTQVTLKLNAMHDYVIRMSRKDLAPARAFWSITLDDLQNGFFIPNDRKKGSVGENAGMKPDKDGGIAIYIAAQKP